MDSVGEKKDYTALPQPLLEDQADVDDLLDFEPVVTAFDEYSLCAQRKSRKNRGFGSKGNFGGGRGGGCSFRKRTNNTYWSSASREALDQESGTLADESSPEFVRKGHALSEDETSVFGSFVAIPPDLCTTTSSLNESLQHLQCEISGHMRSASTVQHRTRAPFFHKRSCSSIALQQQQEQRPVRRPMQRASSLALGTTSSSSLFTAPTNHPWPESAGGNFWEENLHPNELDAIEKTKHPQERKQVRAARRHSITAAQPSFGTRTTSSSSSLTSATTTSFPPDLSWLAPEASPPSRLGDQGNFQDSVTAFSLASASSPAGHSVASSRKRGVCGSPISDHDSSSISDARRTRSRSRIFQVPPGEQMPEAPSLARNLEEDHSSNSSIMMRQQPAQEYGGRGDAMDMDEDTDDEQSVPRSSPDSSFEVMNVVKAAAAPMIPDDDEPSKMKRVFESMSSYEDLKFLIRALRQENRRHCSTVVFGAGDIWKVAPPLNQWTSQRRAAFTAWAKLYLGFTIRSMGLGFMYAQISKTRGVQLLETLEAALIEYKKTEPPGDPIGIEKPSPETLFTSLSMCKIGASMSSFGSASSNSEPPVAILKPSPEDTFMGNDEDDLTSKISSLSVNESELLSRASISMIRQVTLPPDDEIKRIGINDSLRLSIESNATEKRSRPSMESHAHSTDLNLHLHGNSPRIRLGRPPKMSISSMCSTETVNTRGGRSSTPCADDVPCTAFNFVTTPLMNQDRGWGSCPIDGRDWGASGPYDESLMAKLMIRFEGACGMEGSRDSVGTGSIALLPRRSSNLNFDLEVDTLDLCGYGDELVNALARKEAERKHRKRVHNLNKQKRMSLFATATGAKALLPTKQWYALPVLEPEPMIGLEKDESPAELVAKSEKAMTTIFSFFNESELMTKASTVCMAWADWATDAHANLLLACVQSNEEVDNEDAKDMAPEPILERSWKFVHGRFPWACFLAEGGAKKVYKVYNSSVNQEEALSVMDTYTIDNIQIVANELAVSAMLSSLVRRGVCPNFIVIRGVFTCAHPPPESHWGWDEMKCPKGKMSVHDKVARQPKTPKNPEPGRHQYIRMELVNEGDAEELIKRQSDELLPTDVSRAILFQIAFALYVAADKFSVKHYDIKLLNIFIQRADTDGDLVMRYGLGSHVFALRMPSSHAFIAKLADFGTASINPASNGLPVAIAHFTTLENTPPDFMILGDDATQGHEHDSFGLGLSMLQLFTGSKPYEEILEDVACPPNLKKRLRGVWENESIDGYSVIRSVIFDGVDKDEDGHIIEGDPDETFYDTLYRFLVLFGIPDVQFQQKTCPRVWKAIFDSLEPAKATRARGGKPVRKKSGSDVTQYSRDCKKYSIRSGNNIYIARARHCLTSINGGLDLLLRLCAFDPKTRATAMDVLNSAFMEDLREHQPGAAPYDASTMVISYMSFATQN